ncbi:FAD-linked oxidase [Lasiodiplodia theobromae]|uniref:D-lactate dehydrogenase (cytochrome) n=2 Tax=Lasiodiplodia theobromae TaxID=45133 RepID=A0A5N5DVG6_9PEZI|nr:D-lactate dehydrogenase, cytochrome [Lasiodiplodia theobromae]KAF9635787.1 FAD-linked oxidase [Lasiodiplodia theobromae]
MPMSNMIRPHPALRRAPLLSRPPSTIPAAAAFSARVSSPSSALPPRYVSQQRWASGGGSNGRDFMGQLYDSTQARLQREKAEQARFAAQRDLTGRGTKGAGLLALIFVAIAAGYYAGSQKPASLPTDSTVPIYKTEDLKHDTSTGNLQAAWVDFKAIVGEENISTNEIDLKAHAGSEWSSYPSLPGDVPFAVVKPASTDEVSQIMKVCHQRRIPVTPYSGGTSLEGHFAATQGGICIDFSRMDKIVKLNKDDMDVVVQPAVGWEALNEELAEHNLFFPPDPGPGAQIGGMVGTGCSGTNAYRYGTMRDWVLSLTVVLADGTVITTRQRPRKSSAGYDLTRMFIGSEGTLGLVTEATLKLTTKPANTSVAVCSFGSIRDAADCVFRVVGAGVPIAAIEILDDVQMRCINDAGSTAKRWKEAPTLFFKFAGTPTSVKEHISIVQSLAKSAGSKSFEFARSKDEADQLWSARKEALWSVMAKKREAGDKVWTTDVAVPISRLPQIIEETKADIDKSGLIGAIVGHVGDGNFHAILLYNDREHAAADGVVHRMVKRAIEMEGTATGEHGVGLVKRDYLNHELGETTVDAMRKLKQAYDPLCLLNCDKVVRTKKPKPGEVQPW